MKLFIVFYQSCYYEYDIVKIFKEEEKAKKFIENKEDYYIEEHEIND